MPPKTRFTREEIVAAALDLVRHSGPEAVTARGVAGALGASAKVIFGLFPSMEALLEAVMASGEALYQARLAQAMSAGEYPRYKASGMAYIAFARQEKHLFQWLFMRDRTGEPLTEQRDQVRPILKVIQENTGLSEEAAYRFHLEVWVCIHGIAAMIATGHLDWDPDFVDRMLTDVYLGMKNRYCEEKAHESHPN